MCLGATGLGRRLGVWTETWDGVFPQSLAAACGSRPPAMGWKRWNPGQSLAYWPLVGASISSSLGGWPQGLRWGLGAPREEAQGGPASWGLSGAARGVAALQRGSPAPLYLYPL